MKKFSYGNQCQHPRPDITLQRPKPILIHPKRKQTAFIRDEELQWQLEDRVGTPHLSELVPGDDMNVDEQRLEIDVEGTKPGEDHKLKTENETEKGIAASA
jgi:hypothetical protein